MASTAGPAQPCDADSLSVLEADDVVGYRDHLADDLVPGDRVWCLRCKIAFGQVQVGSAHGTYQDAYQNLAKAQLRYRQRFAPQGMAGRGSWFMDHPRSHVVGKVLPHRHGSQHCTDDFG